MELHLQVARTLSVRTFLVLDGCSTRARLFFDRPRSRHARLGGGATKPPGMDCATLSMGDELQPDSPVYRPLMAGTGALRPCGKPGGALDALALGSFGGLLPGCNIAVLATPARPPAAGFAVDLVPRADARCVQRGPLSETGRGSAYRANVGPGGGSFIPAPVETRRSGRSGGARASRDNASPMRPSGQSEPT